MHKGYRNTVVKYFCFFTTISSKRQWRIASLRIFRVWYLLLCSFAPPAYRSGQSVNSSLSRKAFKIVVFVRSNSRRSSDPAGGVGPRNANRTRAWNLIELTSPEIASPVDIRSATDNKRRPDARRNRRCRMKTKPTTVRVITTVKNYAFAQPLRTKTVKKKSFSKSNPSCRNTHVTVPAGPPAADHDPYWDDNRVFFARTFSQSISFIATNACPGRTTLIKFSVIKSEIYPSTGVTLPNEIQVKTIINHRFAKWTKKFFFSKTHEPTTWLTIFDNSILFHSLIYTADRVHVLRWTTQKHWRNEISQKQRRLTTFQNNTFQPSSKTQRKFTVF